MINYFEHKISKNELVKIFKKSIDRSIFIGEYPYFGVDGNEAYYQGFIDDSILKHKYKLQEDAIELSIVLNVYKEFYLAEIKKVLSSRRQEVVKLVCLDWLFYFFQDIPEDEFLEINKYVFQHSKLHLLKVQSLLNILLIKPDVQLISNLILCFIKSDDPAVFYRFINASETNQLMRRFTDITIISIKEIVISKTNISNDQKVEIIKKLENLIVEISLSGK